VETDASAGADFDGLSTAANPTRLTDSFLSFNHICLLRADVSRFVAASACSPVGALGGDAALPAHSSFALSSSDEKASSCLCISLFAGSVDSDCESYVISGRKTGESPVTADGRTGDDAS